MARISGVDLPREKRIEIGLTYIYGIGRTTASKICAETNINPDTRVNDVTDEEVDVIRKYIDEQHLMIEGDLRRERNQNVKRLMDIGCYRGLRHRDGPSGSRPAHAHQRSHPQGSEASDRCQEEEVGSA